MAIWLLIRLAVLAKVVLAGWARESAVHTIKGIVAIVAWELATVIAVRWVNIVQLMASWTRASVRLWMRMRMWMRIRHRFRHWTWNRIWHRSWHWARHWSWNHVSTAVADIIIAVHAIPSSVAAMTAGSTLVAGVHSADVVRPNVWRVNEIMTRRTYFWASDYWIVRISCIHSG